jgi:hypothetical protein
MFGPNESSLRTQGPQRERNCAHRGGEDSRFGTGADAFFHFEARGDGSLRSQGRPVEGLFEATTATTHGSIQSCAMAPRVGGDQSVRGVVNVAAIRSSAQST